MHVIKLQTKRFFTFTIDSEDSCDRDSTGDAVTKYVWLSKRLFDVTKGSTKIAFNSAVIAAIEGDIQKCRETRQLFQNMDFEKYGIRILTEVCDNSFKELVKEVDIAFDTALYPIGEAFAHMLRMKFDDLPRLHEQYSQDKGRLKDRHEKRKLLHSILDPSARDPFQAVFLDFVLKYVAPHVRSITKASRIYFQSFPCIRVVRPGEFSIGPHCDASYGFSQGNINFYIPLTKIFGTNSLILESSPGIEDWHTIELEYGSIKRFYGSQCSHFTAENTTAQTRISLDFRIILDEHWQEDHDHFSSVPGYYASCKFIPVSNINVQLNDGVPDERCNILNDDLISSDGLHSILKENENNASAKVIDDNDGHWVLEGELLEPDWRVGFPFEKQPAVKTPQM